MKWTQYNRKTGAVLAVGDTEKEPLPPDDPAKGIVMGINLPADAIVPLASDRVVAPEKRDKDMQGQIDDLMRRVAILEAQAQK